jgi:uncharacterized protein YukE
MAAETNAQAWDKVVYMVSVLSRYDRLAKSAQDYATVFNQIERIEQGLEKLAVASNKQWNGKGGVAFQEYTRALLAKMRLIRTEHEGIKDALATVSKSLHQAVTNIPIPQWRYNEVQAHQPAFLDGSASYFGSGIPWNLNPPRLVRLPPNSPGGQDALYQQYRERAEAALRKLEADYRLHVGKFPVGTPVDPPRVGPADGASGGKAGRGAGGAGANGLNSGLGSGLGPGGLQTPSGAGLTNSNAQLPNTPAPDLSGLTPPDTGPTDLSDIPGTDTSGLAGFDGSGGGGGGVPGGGTAPAGTVTSGFGNPGNTPRGLTLAGGATGVSGSGGMYPPMYPPMGGGHGGQGGGKGGQGGGKGGQGGNSDHLCLEDEIKTMFGFETCRPTNDAEPDEIPRSGVLEA